VSAALTQSASVQCQGGCKQYAKPKQTHGTPAHVHQVDGRLRGGSTLDLLREGNGRAGEDGVGGAVAKIWDEIVEQLEDNLVLHAAVV